MKTNRIACAILLAASLLQMVSAQPVPGENSSKKFAHGTTERVGKTPHPSPLPLRGGEGEERGQTRGEWAKYLWQTWRTTDIPDSASNLVTELRAETQKILEAGP